MKNILFSALLIGSAALACPPGACKDKNCHQTKVHSTGVGITTSTVHVHDHAHDREMFQLKSDQTDENKPEPVEKDPAKG